METISDKKIDITKKILELNDDAVLNKIEHLLKEIETVAYTSEGEALNKSQYINHIEEISNALKPEQRPVALKVSEIISKVVNNGGRMVKTSKRIPCNYL